MLMPFLCMLAAGVGAALMYLGLSLSARRKSAAGDPAAAPSPKQKLAELQRFRAAMDKCADSIYLIDKETLQFVDATAAALARGRRSREEFLKLGPPDLLQIGRAHV